MLFVVTNYIILSLPPCKSSHTPLPALLQIHGLFLSIVITGIDIDIDINTDIDILKCNLLSQYNVACMYVFRDHY